MAAEIGLGLLSITQIQKLSQSQHHHKNQPQPNPNSTTTTASSTWMWNPKEQEDEDDSWEVRAFAEDTKNIMDTTWPPRSYTCTFCRREFRSAQALGGHMNVHRRDRARLHQTHPPGSFNNSITTPSSHLTSPFINIPPQELVANAGLCLLYHLPSPNSHHPSFNAPSPTSSTLLNANGESPSTLLSISPSYSQNNLVMQTFSPSHNFPVAQAAPGINSFSSYCSNSSKVEQQQQPTTSTSIDNGHHEELDLELRLGHKSAST